jgi:hypothetical protein
MRMAVRAHLDQVAELVDHPQATARRGGRVGPHAPRERIRDLTVIADLADQFIALPPHAQLAVAAGVPHRVGCQLVDREHEIGRLVVAEARGQGLLRDQRAKLGEVGAPEREGDRLRWRLRKRPLAGVGEGMSHEVAAGALVAVIDQRRMGPLRVRDHVLVERVRVVGAEHPHRGVGPGEVDQRLVPDGLAHLLRRASGPDRLAHVMDPASGVGLDHVGHRRDDARGVPAQVRHVDQLNLPRVAVEARTQELEPRARDRGDDRLASV